MISVILANYNGSKHLAEAMRSVLGQDFDDYEFIVVDDGSTDDSRQIITTLAEQNPQRIKAIFSDENRGQGAAFNTGMAHAKGDIITFIDSDDIWFPEKLAGVQQHMQQQPQAVMFQHNLAIMRDAKITSERFRDILTVGDYFSYTRRRKVIPQFIPTTGLAFRRPVLEQVLPVPEQFRTCADGFLTRTAFCYGEIFSVNNCWGAYRIHDANNTFDNPAFSNRKYLSHLLIPALNEFYAAHQIDFCFHDRLAQLKTSFEELSLPPDALLLMLRSASNDIMQDVLEILFMTYPGLSIDLLVPASAQHIFSDPRINCLTIKEGFFNSDTIGEQVLEKIQTRKYHAGIVPYSVNNPYSYHNIHILLPSLNNCPFVAIDYDGYNHPIESV